MSTAPPTAPTPEDMAKTLIVILGHDNGAYNRLENGYPVSQQQRDLLVESCRLLLEHYTPTEDDLNEIVSGECSEVAAKFGHITGYKEVDFALSLIFEGEQP